MVVTVVKIFFTGWLYKLNIPEFKKVNRPHCGRSTDFKQDIVEYIGNNCYIPTNGNCFQNVIINSMVKNMQKNFYLLFELNK